MFRFFATLLITLFCNQLRSQNFDFSAKAVQERITKDVYVLASDSLRGRDGGTEDEKKAAGYVAELMQEAGLSPAFSEDGYFQEFSIYFLVKYRDKNEVTVDGTKYKPYYDYNATAFTGNAEVSGIIQDAGYGISDPDNSRDDYAKIDVTGKIVLINIELPAVYQDKGNKHTSFEARINSAIDRGATGIVLYHPLDIYERSLYYFKTTTSVAVPVIYARPRLWKILTEGKEAKISIDMLKEDVISRNVGGYIDNGAKRTIILGAHFDHIGVSRKGICTGADDNASGTASIIEIGRYLKEHGNKNANYLIIAFGSEEKGLLGSEHFVSSEAFEKYHPDVMINFDMVGRYGLEYSKVALMGTRSSREWRKMIRNCEPDTFRLKKLGFGPPYSDHNGFNKKDVPYLYFTTGLHEDYHTYRDRPDKIVYSGITGIVVYVEKLTEKIAALPEIRYKKQGFFARFYANFWFILQM